VHELLYNYMVKCWYNEEFGSDRSTVVRDHAPYAYRYDLND